MRRLIGSVVLIAGVGGLGYLAPTTHAAGIQSSIRANAEAVAIAAPHGVTAIVSGRDVIVSGRVTDQTELTVLRATFEDLDGVRVVDMSDVQTLPRADPFDLTALRNLDGEITLSGSIPSETDRAALGPAAAGLTLAAGAPDEAWMRAVSIGLDGLNQLNSGDLAVSNRTLFLTGVAADPDNESAALVVFDELPDGYTVTSQIEVEDDGSPLNLLLTLRDGGVVGAAKLPSEMSMSDIADVVTLAQPLPLTQATVPAFDPEWPVAARTSLQALAVLINGDLNLTETALSLTGVATPDGKAEAENLLATLPQAYSVTTDIEIFDDGVPLGLSMDWDGSTATASGKYPAGFSPRGPAGVRVTDAGRTSFLDDPTGAFEANANAGVAALGLMNSGTLMVSETAIVLSGTAASPQVAEMMDNVLAAVANTATIERNLTYLDDGSPAAWTLDYSATTGGDVQGRLPVGLSLSDIADTLGLTDLAGDPVVAFQDDTIGSSLEALQTAARYLPEVETLTFARQGGSTALDLILSPGVDVDLVAVDLAEGLPADVLFSIGPLEDMPSEGTKRTNAATGLDEVFSTGFWLPDLNFEIDAAGCMSASDGVLARSKITFLSGSAQLDATSIRAINGVAAVVRPCLAEGLSLEIGGHTDATGDAASNEALSFDRAAAVRIALIDRGISDRYMSSVGYGQIQPIADNSTPEGRAANRRTSLTWSDASGVPATDP